MTAERRRPAGRAPARAASADDHENPMRGLIPTSSGTLSVRTPNVASTAGLYRGIVPGCEKSARMPPCTCQASDAFHSSPIHSEELRRPGIPRRVGEDAVVRRRPVGHEILDRQVRVRAEQRTAREVEVVASIEREAAADLYLVLAAVREPGQFVLQLHRSRLLVVVAFTAAEVERREAGAAVAEVGADTDRAAGQQRERIRIIGVILVAQRSARSAAHGCSSWSGARTNATRTESLVDARGKRDFGAVVADAVLPPAVVRQADRRRGVRREVQHLGRPELRGCGRRPGAPAIDSGTPSSCSADVTAATESRLIAALREQRPARPQERIPLAGVVVRPATRRCSAASA